MYKNKKSNAVESNITPQDQKYLKGADLIMLCPRPMATLLMCMYVSMCVIYMSCSQSNLFIFAIKLSINRVALTDKTMYEATAALTHSGGSLSRATISSN